MNKLSLIWPWRLDARRQHLMWPIRPIADHKQLPALSTARTPALTQPLSGPANQEEVIAAWPPAIGPR